MKRKTSFVVMISFICFFTFLSSAWSAILIDDTSTKSGVTPEIGDGNTMKFKNELRRRAYALFYLIEAIDGNGNILPYPGTSLIKKVRIPSTQKLEGLIGTILQVIQGNTALTPAYSNNVLLKLPDDCKDCQKAKYKVVVIGSGVGYGDYSISLNAEEEKLLKQLQRETFIFDIAIPVILIVLPDSVKEYFGKEITSIDEDLLFLRSFTPLLDTIMTKLMEGDTKSAAQDFFNSFVTNSDLQEKMAEYLIKSLKGEVKEQAEAAIKSALESLDITNIIMTVLDQIAIIRDITSEDTHMADLWYLQVMPKTLHIKPRSSTITYEDSVVLTVQVKDGGQPYKSNNLIFVWESEERLGYFSASDVPTGDSVISTKETLVEYAALSNALSGKDTVTVTAYENGEEVGSTSAKVYIRDDDEEIYTCGGCRAYTEKDGFGDPIVTMYYPVSSCERGSWPCLCYDYYINTCDVDMLHEDVTQWCNWSVERRCMSLGSHGYGLYFGYSYKDLSEIIDNMKEWCVDTHLTQTFEGNPGKHCPCEEWCYYYYHRECE